MQRFIGYALGAWFFFAMGTAQAQQITPSHVLQVADDVVNELTHLLDANFSNTALPAPVDFQGKRPRHVIQKARQILLKVQTLKGIYGLPLKELEPIPVREIRPKDVKGWVEKVLVSIRELKGVFKVTATPAAAPLPEKKTPSHVFQRLDQVEVMVGRLDIPAIVPNDVYRVTLSMVDDMAMVAKGLGATETVDWRSRKEKGKSPGDVYDAAYALLEDLKALTENNKSLAIPGGIMLPPKKTGKRTPSDAIEIQNTILAELSSIKNKAMVKAPTKVFPPQAAKTPSDVFVAVLAAGEYAALAAAAAKQPAN